MKDSLFALIGSLPEPQMQLQVEHDGSSRHPIVVMDVATRGRFTYNPGTDQNKLFEQITMGSFLFCQESTTSPHVRTIKNLTVKFL